MEDINVVKLAVDWLLDVAKYILTAIVVTAVFAEIKERDTIILVGLAIMSACLLGVLVLVIYNKSTIKKYKQHEHRNDNPRLHSDTCDSNCVLYNQDRPNGPQPEAARHTDSGTPAETPRHAVDRKKHKKKK